MAAVDLVTLYPVTFIVEVINIYGTGIRHIIAEAICILAWSADN